MHHESVTPAIEVRTRVLETGHDLVEHLGHGVTAPAGAPTRYVGTLESTKNTTALDVGEHLTDVASGVVAGQSAVQRVQSTARARNRLGFACSTQRSPCPLAGGEAGAASRLAQRRRLGIGHQDLQAGTHTDECTQLASAGQSCCRPEVRKGTPPSAAGSNPAIDGHCKTGWHRSSARLSALGCANSAASRTACSNSACSNSLMMRGSVSPASLARGPDRAASRSRTGRRD